MGSRNDHSVVKRGETSLFRWFGEFLSSHYVKSLKGSPFEVVQAAGIPPQKYLWLNDLKDEIFPLIEREDGLIPDLETRCNQKKRSIGQFFTPELLVSQLLDASQIIEGQKKILDPACGDGAFLRKALQWLKENERSTRSITVSGWDIDPQALLVCLARLLQAGGGKVLPELLHRDFLLFPPQEKYDLILSNPPYKVNLPPETKSKLSELYETAEGEKDLYTFFLEGGIKALQKQGSLLMLTSHTFLVNHQCKKIRDFIFAKHCVRAIFLLPPGYFQMAPGVVPVIIYLTNQSPATVCRVLSEYSEIEGWQTDKLAPVSDFKRHTGLRQALRAPELSELFEIMEKGSQQLGSLARVGVGIQESSRRGQIVSRFVSDRASGDNSVKVLKGREIGMFETKWEGKFLDYGSHLTYKGDPEVFRGKKILYQNLRNESLHRRIVATLDSDGFFPKNSLSYICRPTPPFSLEFILGIINSTPIDCWFRENYYSFHVTVTQMRTVPIPNASMKNQEAVEKIVKDCLRAGRNSINELPEFQNQLDWAVWQCFFSDSKLAGNTTFQEFLTKYAQ